MGGSSGTNTITQQQNPYAPAQGGLQTSVNLADLARQQVQGTPSIAARPATPGYWMSGAGPIVRQNQWDFPHQVSALQFMPGTPAQPFVQGTPGIPLPQRLPGNLMEQGAGVLGNTIGGQYLDINNNPYLQQIMRQAASGTAAQFEGGSRYGSGVQQQAILNTLGQLGYQNYAAERANQLQAAGAAPTYEQSPYALYASQVGAPFELARQYQGILGQVGQAGVQGYQTSPYYTNPALQAIGALGSLGTAGLAAKQAGLFGGATYPTAAYQALNAGYAGLGGSAGVGGGLGVAGGLGGSAAGLTGGGAGMVAGGAGVGKTAGDVAMAAAPMIIGAPIGI